MRVCRARSKNQRLLCNLWSPSLFFGSLDHTSKQWSGLLPSASAIAAQAAKIRRRTIVLSRRCGMERSEWNIFQLKTTTLLLKKKCRPTLHNWKTFFSFLVQPRILLCAQFLRYGIRVNKFRRIRISSACQRSQQLQIHLLIFVVTGS